MFIIAQEIYAPRRCERWQEGSNGAKISHFDKPARRAGQVLAADGRMSERPLTLRDLNRATLVRQMLIERADRPVRAAIEWLGGLQAQLPMPPYVGLWTRLNGFERASLSDLIQQHAVVKPTWLRATLHLVSADDFIHLRATLQPALARAAESITKRTDAQIDHAALLESARAFLCAQPRTFAELSDHLQAEFPGQEVGPLRYTVRTHLPLVQVPVEQGWGFPGNPRFTLADDWLGREIDPAEHLPELVRRYLAAFGPASPADMQAWSGLAGLKQVFEQMRPELVSHRYERRELFDLPGAPMPAPDLPVPPRFLPEFDNLLLSHSNRERVVPTEYRPRVYLSALRVPGTILVDGFVRASWKVEQSKRAAVLLIAPFAARREAGPLGSAERVALEQEGGALLRFIAPEAASYDIRFVEEPPV